MNCVMLGCWLVQMGALCHSFRLLNGIGRRRLIRVPVDVRSGSTRGAVERIWGAQERTSQGLKHRVGEAGRESAARNGPGDPAKLPV